MNNFVLDGVDANAFGSNTLGSVPVPSPDAVGEFRVSTSMYDASQGRGSGGNINVVLRSGTDKFHGGAYEFYRSNDMNANDFFANEAGKPVTHPAAESVRRTDRRPDSEAEGHFLVLCL